MVSAHEGTRKSSGNGSNGGKFYMNAVAALKTQLDYGRKLVSSGLAGAQLGRENTQSSEPMRTVLWDSAMQSLRLAAVGYCVGLLRRAYLRGGGRRSEARVLAAVLAGGAIGFSASFTWRTRNLTRATVHSALKEIERVRNERWLHRHPINYA